MSPQVLKRRKVNPRRAYRALLVDQSWTLIFNHQGGFGNLGPKRLLASSTLPAYEGPVEGVLFLLTKQDLNKLEAAETGYKIGTVRVEVPGPTHGHNTTVDALVFLSRWDMQLPTSLPPTGSYRDKLRDGALHYNLSTEYVAWLDSLPVLTGGDIPGSRALPDIYYQTPSSKLAAPILLSIIFVLYRIMSSFAFRQ